MKNLITTYFNKISIILFIVLFFTDCKVQEEYPCITNIEKELKKRFNENNQFNFNATVNCFSWDSLLIFAPIFNKKRFEKLTHIILPKSINTDFPYGADSDYWQLAFLKNGEVVSNFSLSKWEFDFSKDSNYRSSGEDWVFIDKKASSVQAKKVNGIFNCFFLKKD